MTTPAADIAGCAVAHERLREIVGRLIDADPGRPSLLPGWTVGHVLAHLARNAEAMCARIEAARVGETVEQYPGGRAGRAAQIEAGADRSMSVIVDDVDQWSRRLDTLFAEIDDEVWTHPVRTVAGGEHPVSDLPFRRWREVEVHLVDLDVGPTRADWSDAFVDRALPGLVERLSARTDRHHLVAWLLGRSDAPELDAWG